MPKGKYNHKPRRGERNGEIEKYLGRRPKDMSEYKKIWRFLFSGLVGKNRDAMKVQRARHLTHGYGNPSAAKKYCIFCEKR